MHQLLHIAGVGVDVSVLLGQGLDLVVGQRGNNSQSEKAFVGSK
jgi:hypothetical protein